MKVPPKRKGNAEERDGLADLIDRLNESPSEKEGKSGVCLTVPRWFLRLNESPSEKEGKSSLKRGCLL